MVTFKELSYYFRSLNTSILFFLAYLVLGFLGFFLTEKTEVNLSQPLAAWSETHLLGTDILGRDLLTRLWEALYLSVPILCLVTVISYFFGVFLASLRLSNTGNQSLLVLFDIVSSLFSGLPLIFVVFWFTVYADFYGLQSLVVCMALIVSLRGYHWVNMQYKESANKAYWQAHHCLGGASMVRIFCYGILKDWRPQLKVELTQILLLVLITEASLSYLGFGIQEPSSSLGNILAGHLSALFSAPMQFVGLLFFSIIMMLQLPKSIANLIDCGLGLVDVFQFSGSSKKIMIEEFDYAYSKKERV